MANHIDLFSRQKSARRDPAVIMPTKTSLRLKRTSRSRSGCRDLDGTSAMTRQCGIKGRVALPGEPPRGGQSGWQPNGSGCVSRFPFPVSHFPSALFATMRRPLSLNPTDHLVATNGGRTGPGRQVGIQKCGRFALARHQSPPTPAPSATGDPKVRPPRTCAPPVEQAPSAFRDWGSKSAVTSHLRATSRAGAERSRATEESKTATTSHLLAC